MRAFAQHAIRLQPRCLALGFHSLLQVDDENKLRAIFDMGSNEVRAVLCCAPCPALHAGCLHSCVLPRQP